MNKLTLGAAITAAALAVAPFASAATVVNGSFEQDPGSVGINNGNSFAAMPGASGNASWDVFKTVPGWTTDAGDGVELQTANTIPLSAYDGNYYAELDGNQNSTISQMVTFGVGKYKLSFAFSPRVAGNTGTNQISYGVDGLFDLVVTGPSASYPLNVWTVVTQIFTVTTAGNYALYFDAAGKSDSLGGFIDGIEVAAVPVPAAGFMLFGALGGLAALRRRKSTAA